MPNITAAEDLMLLNKQYAVPHDNSIVIPDCLVCIEEPAGVDGYYVVTIQRGNDKLTHTLSVTPNDKDLIGMATFIDAAITELYKYFIDLDTTDMKRLVMHDCNHEISIDAVDCLRMDGAVDHHYIQICNINNGGIDANAKPRLVVVLGKNGETITHLSSKSLKQLLDDKPETLIRSGQALRLLDVALSLGDGEKLYDYHDTYSEVKIDPEYHMMTNTQRMIAKLNDPNCAHFNVSGVELTYKMIDTN